MKLPVEVDNLEVALQYGCWGVLGAVMVLRAAAVELQSGQLSLMEGPQLTRSATAKSLKVTVQLLSGSVPAQLLPHPCSQLQCLVMLAQQHHALTSMKPAVACASQDG